MTLPTEHTFTIEHNGAALVFTFTMPTMRERTKIGLAEARMREGVSVGDLDEITRSLISQLAFLSATVTCPEGVSFNEDTSPALMNSVFKEVIEYEGRFLDG